jgi:hypothetical protein
MGLLIYSVNAEKKTEPDYKVIWKQHNCLLGELCTHSQNRLYWKDKRKKYTVFCNHRDASSLQKHVGQNFMETLVNTS